MFKFFRKKKKITTETDEIISVMTTEEVLLGINAIQKRSKIDKHYAHFLNASIAKKTCKQLKRKGYNVETYDLGDNCPSFKVSWD